MNTQGELMEVASMLLDLQNTLNTLGNYIATVGEDSPHYRLDQTKYQDIATGLWGFVDSVKKWTEFVEGEALGIEG